MVKNNGKGRKGGMVMLGFIKKRLMQGFLLSKILGIDKDEEVVPTAKVPEDVKEGQFVVFAVNGGEKKRFVVELSYLSHPEFLRLLEQAEEEFGFEHEGALSVPCRPDDLQRILGD